MNNSALVMIYKGELSNNYTILDEYHIVIITEIIDMEIAESINKYCRFKKIGFVYTAQFGLSSFIFTDFGENFKVEDINGKECEKYFIKSITNSCPGIVEIDPIKINNNGIKKKKYLKLGTGDFVIFKNVKGMTELNNTPPRPIKVLSKTKFTIEDTSKFQEFSGSGMVEEVKIPFPLVYKSLSESKNNIYNEYKIEDDFDDDFNSEIINDENIFNSKNKDNFPWIKFLSSSNLDNNLGTNINEKIHLAVLSLHTFFNKHLFLPHFNQRKEIDECFEISKNILYKAKAEKRKWVNNINKIDNIFFEKIFKFSRFYFTPMTCFLGGVISQEILKFIGLYKPSNQWMYFSFLDLIDENNFQKNCYNQILDDTFKRNIEPFMLFGKEKLSEIKNTNILIIGLNDIGYEILRILIMLNLISQNNNIVILENNKNEINQKMNDLKNNEKNHNINIISDKIDLNSKISEKNWWKESIIIFDTLSYDIYPKEKTMIIKNSKKDKKILIDINVNKSIGAYEIYLPNQFGFFKNLENKINSFEEIDTPDGSNYCQKESYIKKKKFNNIYTLEESLKWSKNYFENNFSIYIKYLNELINKSDSEEEIRKYLDNIINKEKDNEKMLKMILTFKKLISLKLGKAFESIVFYSIEIFQELFEFSIDEILQKFPFDLINEKNCKKFWSGARIVPKKIKFDINIEEHYQIIYYLTYFLCEVLQIDEVSERMKDIKNIATKYEFKKFDLTMLKKANNEDFFNIEKNSLIQFLGEILKINKFSFKEIKINYFENIQEINDLQNINKQIKIVILIANLKLDHYEIKKNVNDFISLILKKNDILPSVSSIISGVSIIQLFKMFNDIYFNDYIKLIKEGKIINEIDKKENINENLNRININEDENNTKFFYKNYIFNLASNIYLDYNII